MGLLDQFLPNLNLDDPKTLGLLAAGLQMMSPTSMKMNAGGQVAQGLLGGIGAYGAAQTAQQKLAQEKLQQQMLGLQVENAKQDFADQQAARNIFQQRRGGLLSTPNNTGNLDTAGTPSLYGGQPAPYDASQAAPMQPPSPMSLTAGGPSAIPFGKSVAVANTPAGASQGKFDTFNKYNALADQMEQAGLLKQAIQYRDMAEKFRPKLKDEQVRLQNGSPVVVRNYEDGTTEVSPFNPTANLEYLDTKNAKLPINKYTGGMGGQPIPMGIDPADAQRLALERARVQYETGAGGAPGAGSGGSASAGNLPPAVRAQIAKSQAEALNAGGVTYKNALDQTVNTGNDLMTRIAESRKALDGFRPGMGAEARLNAARVAQLMNAPEGLVSAINGGNVAAKQEFQKLAAQQAMETLKAAMGGTGRITQAEFKVFQQNNPNIELDPNAIRKIYDFAQKTHTRNVAEQAGLNSYLKEGGNISQWPTEWTKRIGGGVPPTSGFRYLGKE